MNVKQFVYFGLALLSVGFMVAQAAMPNTIQVQGRVSVNGTNYSGTGNFKFALVMHPVAHRRQATARAVRTGQFITSIEMEDGGSGSGGCSDPVGRRTDICGRERLAGMVF